MSYIAKLGQEFGQYVVQLTGQLLLSNQSLKSLSEMERQGQVVTVKQGVQAVLGLGGEPHQNGAVGDESTLVADL